MEFADFDGMVLNKPCPVCGSELTYEYTHKNEQDYHEVKCTKHACTFMDKCLDNEPLIEQYGGFANPVETLNVDRLALDVQQLQEMFEAHKCCMNCWDWGLVSGTCLRGFTFHGPRPVCSKWISFKEERADVKEET